MQYSLVDFRILGPLEAWEGGQRLPLGGAKQRAVLAILLLEANRVVSTERLIELVWGDDPPETVGNTLQVAISQLRKVLEPGHARGDPYRVLVSQEPGYMITLTPDELDLGRFEQLRAGAREAMSDGNPQSAADHLRAALALWRGMPFADLANESYVIAEANRLNDISLQALEDRIEADLALGRHRELVGELEETVTEYPLRERFRAQLMLALYRSGRQAEASDIFHKTRAVLVDQLGMEPGPALQKLFKSILNQDQSLDLSPARERPLTNLPLELTSFVGRQGDLAEVNSLLARYRLVTLTGAGGVGKTRLALRVARESIESYPDGVWLVELASVTNPDHVAQAAATACDVREQIGIPLSTTLTRHLANRKTLLVIDNCEHVIAAVAVLVTTILQGCPEIRVLCTSREELRVPGEISWRVPSLVVPPANKTVSPDELAGYEAIRLFRERAGTSTGSFPLTEHNAQLVREICEHLDGIPLAIELAAAKLKNLTVGQVAQRLGDRFRLLTDGSRTALPRQQTLRATIDWSYELLNERERALLRRLAVFLGGFTLESAEQICSGEPIQVTDVMGLLLRLAEKSFVTVDSMREEARYELLETIRQYADERLELSGESTEFRNQHLRWFLSIARRASSAMHGPEQLWWLTALETEHDNLRTALQWSREHGETAVGLAMAGALGIFWRARGYLSEGRQSITDALRADSTATPAVRAEALAWGAALAMDQCDYLRAGELAEESRKLSNAASSLATVGFALETLASAHWVQDEYGAAESLLEAAIEAYRQVDHQAGVASAVKSLGHVATAKGQFDRSKAMIEKSIAISESIGDQRAVADARIKLGESEAWAGHLDNALRLLTQSMAFSEPIEAQGDIAIGLYLIGMVQRHLGDRAQAAASLNRSLKVARDLNDPQYAAYALYQLAVLAHEESDYPRATALVCESLRAVIPIGDRWAIARHLEELGAIGADKGMLDRGAQLMGAAEGLRDAIGAPITPLETSAHERRISTMEAAMGRDRFKKAWALGRSLEFEEALSLALGLAAVLDSERVETRTNPQPVR